jgi:hypothetical protein
MKQFSDLLIIDDSGKLHLPPEVHHIPDLLDADPARILEDFRKSQVEDFLRIIESSDDILQKILPGGVKEVDLPFLEREAFRDLFLELHEHVMGHPVWLHPFFLRIFRGEFELPQLKDFALHYFNQIKNTRQCVALSLGRFHGLNPLRHGVYSERISELTQIILSQLVADEFGVSTHSTEDYPTLEGIFQSTTHIVMYRKIFQGLGVPFEMQDVPMLPEVADNVLIQRILAGNERFSELESLASVGLGMEWGVPEFFSLLLAGIIRFAYRENINLTRDHLQVLIAHVKYDVMHAISVMFATAFYINNKSDIQKTKEAVNTLMAGRYSMMSGLYRHIFNEDCGDLSSARTSYNYAISGKRVEEELIRHRRSVPDGRVLNQDIYRMNTGHPFVYEQKE